VRIEQRFLFSAAIAGVLSLSACGGGSQPAGSATQAAAPASLPSLQTSGHPLAVAGKGNAGMGIPVNAYLWRATLDTLAFMPLVSADPFGGVIITDWYSPPATPNERFKANAYILGQQMSADALRVTVFHQVQQGGQWTDAPVDPETVSGLEDRILARAADLRAAAENSAN
jgi:hypothetical protein